MCGVFGFILNHPLDNKNIEKGKAATLALKHRGPDNVGFWYDAEAGVFLGHTRLSILDTSSLSNQPMQLDNSVMTFNGEIYNYRELKQDLSISSKTSGDTEVLLRSWIKEGPAVLDKLDGMYAFAVYDTTSRTLSVANDPFGEKPLYYIKNNQGFYFSSEPAPLINLFKLQKDLSNKDIAAYLTLGFIPGQKTGFKQLNCLEPASLLNFSLSTGLEINKYWKPSEGEIGKGKVKRISENDLDDISQCLLESLKVRLRSDVPLGLFLSAGIDSSLIASLIKKELNQDVDCLTVSFSDKDVRDESLHASSIAKFLELPHQIVKGGEDPTHDNPQMIYDIVGEVNSNTTVGAVYLISKAARKHFKVALCGLGGDELFFGYNKYRDLYVLNSFTRKLKTKLKKIIGRDFGVDFSSLNSKQQFFAIKHYKNYNFLKTSLDFTALEDFFYSQSKESFVTARYFDLTQTMPHCYILGMERASMRVALELRTPFLNRKLYDLLSQFDARSFVHFGRKDVAKRLLGRYLPEDLLKFPKNGFRSSVQKVYRNKPNLPLNKSMIDHFWNNKTNKHFELVASRMVTLDYFYNNY